MPYTPASRGTEEYTFERENDDGDLITADVTVDYETEAYYPEVSPSMSDPGAPAEGGNIEIVSCKLADGTEYVPTAVEQQELLDHLYSIQSL